MKHLRFLLCLALAVTLLTACGPKGDGSASSSGGGSSVSSSGSGSVSTGSGCFTGGFTFTL